MPHHTVLTVLPVHYDARKCAEIKYACGAHPDNGHVYVRSSLLQGEACLSEGAFKGLLAFGEALLLAAYESRGHQPVSLLATAHGHEELQLRYCSSMAILVSAHGGSSVSLTAEELLALLRAHDTALGLAKESPGRWVTFPSLEHHKLGKLGRMLLKDRPTASGNARFNPVYI